MAFQYFGGGGGMHGSDLRADEQGVRVLFVEHSAEYAALVCETLDCASHGNFEVRHAPRLDAAVEDLERGDYDAVLLDFTRCAGDSGEDATDSIDWASRLASRLPVIVLTGEDEDLARAAETEPVEEAAVRDRIEHSRLPEAILRAVRRYRRLGQQSASEPIVLRDPLRALAKTFARFGRQLRG